MYTFRNSAWWGIIQEKFQKNWQPYYRKGPLVLPNNFKSRLQSGTRLVPLKDSF